MSFKIFDRIAQLSTGTGTGNFDLDGAALTGFEKFEDRYTPLDTLPYLITDDSGNWEIGLGSFVGAGPYQLVRTTVLASTNADAAVNWTAGNKTVSVVEISHYLATNPRWAKFTPPDNAAIGADATLPVLSGDALLAMGPSVIASGQGAVAIGKSNEAAGDNSFAGGGVGVQINTACAASLGGENGGVNGSHSVNLGGKNAYDTDWSGAGFVGSGSVDGSGSEVMGVPFVVANKVTTSATETAMGFDGDATTHRILVMGTNGLYVFDGLVSAFEEATGDSKSWRFEATVKVVAGTASFVDTPVVTIIDDDAGAAAWDFQVELGTSPNRVLFNATGEAAHTITWGLMARALISVLF
jgi:hypothetical protein